MKFTPSQLVMIQDGLPAAAIIDAERRRASWQNRTMTILAQDAFYRATPAVDRATCRAAEQAAAEERMLLKARMDQINPKARKARKPKETTMAKNAKKTVTSRLKAKPGKSPAPLKKPVPARRKPDSESHHTIKLSEISPKLAAKVKSTKLAAVVALLTRPEGCTSADIMAVTSWPSVSVPQQARAAGLTLRQEKEGRATRYWGTKTA
jgi:Protein of unknown function (DUF3489)